MSPIVEQESVTDFAESEDAGMTVLSLFLFTGMLLASGLAIDFNNMVQSQTQLQGAADSAGHAALYWRWRNSEAEAKDKGVEIAEMNMPPARYGNVLATSDIEFGWWDPLEADPNDRFKPSNTRQTAVKVTTRRQASNNNGISTFLMHFLGYDALDVTTVSYWDSGNGFCPPKENGEPAEGFYARGIVDVQSNNTYQDGFCIHSSKSWVELQQGGSFEEGVTVSMPDRTDVVLPNSGLDQNSGLAEALESQAMDLDAFFNNLSSLISNYGDPYSDVNANRITDTNINEKTLKANLTMADIVPGAVNVLKCNSKTLTIDNNVVISDAVIITPCEVKFSSGAALESSVLISTNTSDKAISAPSGLRIGSSTYCTSRDGASTVISMGDFTVSSGLEVYGSTVIAMDDINFTSKGNGLGGMSMYAGDRIDANSNGDMGFCDYGPQSDFLIPIFRMVM